MELSIPGLSPQIHHMPYLLKRCWSSCFLFATEASLVNTKSYPSFSPSDVFLSFVNAILLSLFFWLTLIAPTFHMQAGHDAVGSAESFRTKSVFMIAATVVTTVIVISFIVWSQRSKLKRLNIFIIPFTIANCCYLNLILYNQIQLESSPQLPYSEVPMGFMKYYGPATLIVCFFVFIFRFVALPPNIRTMP